MIKQIKYFFYKQRLKKHIKYQTFLDNEKDILQWLNDHNIMVLFDKKDFLIIKIHEQSIYSIEKNERLDSIVHQGKTIKHLSRYPFLVSCSHSMSFMEQNLTWIPVKFKRINGSFNISHNHLTSLECMPDYIDSDCAIQHNQLESLQHITQNINGSLYADYNKIKNLIFFPQKVNKEMYLHYGKHQSHDFYFWQNIHFQENSIYQYQHIVESIYLSSDIKKIKKI